MKSCIWCPAPRARNDLCNRCRQKVESRARRLMEQKLSGDLESFEKMTKYVRKHINLDELNARQYHSLLDKIFPFLVEL